MEAAGCSLESRPFQRDAVSPCGPSRMAMPSPFSESEAHTAQTLLDEEERNNHFPAMIPNRASLAKLT